MFQKMRRTSTHAVQCATLIAPYKILAPSFPHDFSGKTSEAKFRACAHPVRGSAFSRYFKTTAALICALRARINGWIPAKIMRE